MPVYHNDSLAVVRLQDQIAAVREKLNNINQDSLVEYTGKRFDDTLMAVDADNKRDYWENKLLELEALLKQYISPVEATVGSGIAEGDRVILSRRADNARMEFRFTQRVELFPDERCITPSSPIGEAIQGKVPGQSVQVKTPAGESEFEVVEIDRG
jgi:transcription elongation GreA/GreB family factor